MLVTSVLAVEGKPLFGPRLSFEHFGLIYFSDTTERFVSPFSICDIT